MSDARKAKRMVLAIEVPRDELALRIAQPCIGVIAAAGTDARQALDDMDKIQMGMGDGFRRAADAAMAYFHECVNAARQPS